MFSILVLPEPLLPTTDTKLPSATVSEKNAEKHGLLHRTGVVYLVMFFKLAIYAHLLPAGMRRDQYHQEQHSGNQLHIDASMPMDIAMDTHAL